MTRNAPKPSRRVFTCVLVAIALQTLIAVPTIVAKLRSGPEDTDIYYRYVTLAWEGKRPYVDFRVEYPPFAMVLFLVARFIAADVAGFKTAFAVEMLTFNAGTVLLVGSWVARREGAARVPFRVAWYSLSFVILSRLIVARFDAAAAFFCFAATVSWFSGRQVVGGLWAAIGALTKIYPGIVPLVAAAWDVTRPGTARGKGLLAFLGVSVLGMMAWLAFANWHGVIESLHYHLERGFEYGSVYSGLQMLAAKLAGAEIFISRDHGCFSSITPWSKSLLHAVLPIQALAIVMTCAVFVRRGMTEGVRYTGAAILAFIVTGKVFSPQYLIWMMPYIAVLHGPIAVRGRWLFIAVCAATLLAPSGLSSLPRTSLWVILAYNVRNVLIVWLFVLLVWGRSAESAQRAKNSADDALRVFDVPKPSE